MKIVSDMPESGNFVAVWDYQGLIWCDTFLFIDKVLHIYRADDDEGNIFDDWEEVEPEMHPGIAYNPVGITPNRYFIVKD